MYIIAFQIMDKNAKIKFLSFALLSALFLACEENCDQPSCLPGPEGTIRSGSKNLTISTRVNDIQRITLVGNKEYTLSLDGLNPEQGMFFSRWQTVPDSDYTIVEVVVAGEPIEVAISDFLNSEQLQMKITEENSSLDIQLSTFKKCDDTPCD